MNTGGRLANHENCSRAVSRQLTQPQIKGPPLLSAGCRSSRDTVLRSPHTFRDCSMPTAPSIRISARSTGSVDFSERSFAAKPLAPDAASGSVPDEPTGRSGAMNLTLPPHGRVRAQTEQADDNYGFELAGQPGSGRRGGQLASRLAAHGESAACASRLLAGTPVAVGRSIRIAPPLQRRKRARRIGPMTRLTAASRPANGQPDEILTRHHPMSIPIGPSRGRECQCPHPGSPTSARLIRTHRKSSGAISMRERVSRLRSSNSSRSTSERLASATL